jgi:hypothetical protein
MSRAATTLGLLVALASGLGCSSGGGTSPAGTGGGGGTAGGGGAAGGSAGSGTGGGSGGSGFLNAASCGQRGSATANTTTYDGTEDFFIIGDAGLGSDVCVVEFNVKRVAAAPAGCPSCNWSHLVEYSNPVVMTNVGGACDASDSVPPLDAAGRAQLTGMRVGRGFSHTTGHGDALLKYDDAMQMWLGVGRANWDEPTSSLGYNIMTGNCSYGR